MQNLAIFWCLFFYVDSIFCQSNENFLFQLDIEDERTYDYFESQWNQSCGFSISDLTYFPSQKFEGELIWTKDIYEDSLCCHEILTNLTGKIALIRRGNCEFRTKILNAQKAGAKMVIIVNDSQNPKDDECTTMKMSANAKHDLKIPCLSAARLVGDKIDDAIQRKKKVTFSTSVLSLFSPSSAYHYATPIEQLDSFPFTSINYQNNSDSIQKNITLTTIISAPNGHFDTIKAIIKEIAPQKDVFVSFPTWIPQKVLGTHYVSYTHSLAKTYIDTISSKFIVTPNTWSQANFSILKGGIEGKCRLNEQCLFSPSGHCIVNQKKSCLLTHVTFGISNAEKIYSASNLSENTVNIIIYESNADTIHSFFGNWEDLDLPIVGYSSYQINGKEIEGNLINVGVIDVESQDSFITLKPRHTYYAVLNYTKPSSQASHIAFSSSIKNKSALLPYSPFYYLDNIYQSFVSQIMMVRLQTSGYQPIKDITSNENQPTMPLDLDFFKANYSSKERKIRVSFIPQKIQKEVFAQLISKRGDLIDEHFSYNVVNGIFDFDCSQLPSGMYTVKLKSLEGFALKTVEIPERN
jgi:PA domain